MITDRNGTLRNKKAPVAVMRINQLIARPIQFPITLDELRKRPEAIKDIDKHPKISRRIKRSGAEGIKKQILIFIAATPNCPMTTVLLITSLSEFITKTPVAERPNDRVHRRLPQANVRCNDLLGRDLRTDCHLVLFREHTS